ncbi:MAG: DUF998 domain-containing protein [Alphaproteobacteria bacterium]|nr:DUF998 domain-containing protein [Alphaproteobacteria bacterium]
METLQNTDRLLLAGVAAALLFFVVPTIEIFRRPGFDLERHAISMLSLGDGGWIMKTVFAVSGILTLAAALGFHNNLPAGWAAILAAVLIGAYGVGLIVAGIYDAPAGLGFPAGTPIDQQPVMTREANLHGLGFMIAFGGLIAACFVFAALFWQSGGILGMAFSLLAGIAMPALVVLGMSGKIAPGIAFYWAAMLGWAWLAFAALNPPAAA